MSASCDEEGFEGCESDCPVRRVRRGRRVTTGAASSSTHLTTEMAFGRMVSGEKRPGVGIGMTVGAVAGRKARLQPSARTVPHGSAVLSQREPAADRCRFRQVSNSRRTARRTGPAASVTSSVRVVAAARPRRAAVRAGSSSRSRGPTTLRPDSSGADLAQRAPAEDACYAFSLANAMNWQRLQEWQGRLLRHSAVGPQAGATTGPQLLLVSLNKEILLLKVGHKDCFVFNFGCLVCWGCNPQEATAARDALQPFLLEPFAKQDVDEDSVGLRIFRQLRETQKVAAARRDPPTFEKVALAYALAQSVRLGSLELRIDRWVEKTKGIPETMARTGHVSVSSTKVTQMMGELFVLRNQVNLETAIVDTPEFFWDYDMFEPLYLHCRGHLDLDRRIEVLNQRFQVLQDLLDVLENELNEQHATRLEWIVIWLCAVEAAFTAFRFYQRTHSGVLEGGTGGHPSEALALGEQRQSSVLRYPLLWTAQLLYQHFVQRPASLLLKLSTAAPAGILMLVVSGALALCLRFGPHVIPAGGAARLRRQLCSRRLTLRPTAAAPDRCRALMGALQQASQSPCAKRTGVLPGHQGLAGSDVC